MAIAGSFRGGLQVGSFLYGAWTDEVYTVNQSGDLVLYSTLDGADKIFIAANNATTPGIAVVSNNTAFIIDTTASAVSNYPDGDVGSPTCVREHMGYLMFGYGDGTIQASDLNSTNINTLNQARTESNPDGVINMVSYQGQLYVFGDKTIEVWGDPVNDSGFPLTRIGYHIVPGLLTAHAVAGWEPEFGYPFIWVGSDATVRQLDGYGARRISTDDLDRLIADVVFPDADLDAMCYVAGGNAYWQLNGPDWSWVYEVNNGTWFERKTEGLDKSKLTRSVPAFDKWLTGSTQSTDLLEFDHAFKFEGSDQLVASMESGPAKDFPRGQRIARADFDFVPGVGITTGTDPIQTDPTVQLEVSRDGGRTWPLSYVRDLGRQGESRQRIFINNLGVSEDEGPRFRWTVSDPVDVGFTGSTCRTRGTKQK